MTDSNISQLHKPEPIDLLQQVLKQGAQQLLAKAMIESEVQDHLSANGSMVTEDGKAGLVRNGYLPERTIQTGLGDKR